MKNTKDIIITLVHGTFAQKNKWAKNNSIFCESINKHTNRRIEFRTFKWSGDNKHVARIEEAKMFCKYIEELDLSKSVHYVIAHSHGGNLVNYAEKFCPEIEHKIKGKIFLATPHFKVEKRDLKKSEFLFDWMG